jgi:hypothetical protein
MKVVNSNIANGILLDGQARHVFYENGDPSSDISYNSQNQIIESISYLEGSPFSKHTYEYDAMKRLVTENNYTYSPQDDTYWLWLSTTYMYDSPSSLNPKSGEAVRGDGSPAYSYTYEFDDKKTPASAVQLRPLFWSANNLTHATEYRYTLDRTFETDFTYQYNSQGYPTKVTAVSETTGDPKTLTYTYTYDCH